jgi:hypothetical protein
MRDTILMLQEGGTQVSLISRRIRAIVAVSFYVLVLLALASCGNNGPIMPSDHSNGNSQPNLSPVPGNIDTNPRIDIHNNVPSHLSIIPKDEVSSASVQDLATALYLLREKGGGITSVESLNHTEFVLHIWDADSGTNLSGTVAVSCANGTSTIADVNGWAVFEGAVFPISVSVKVPGYTIETYAKTSGNVLSFPMDLRTEPPPAYLFGLADDQGFGSVEIFTDELFPRRIVVYPSQVDAGFCQYQIPFSANHVHGFSAFLRGNLSLGNSDQYPGQPVTPQMPLLMTAEINSEVGPFQPGLHTYCMVGFDSNVQPSGMVHGSASVLTNYWTGPSGPASDILVATPTAIFTHDERYIAFGPSRQIAGDSPTVLRYHCPYFEPPANADRVVMAGQMTLASGGMDIVHSDWVPGTDPDKLTF